MRRRLYLTNGWWIEVDQGVDGKDKVVYLNIKGVDPDGEGGECGVDIYPAELEEIISWL